MVRLDVLSSEGGMGGTGSFTGTVFTVCSQFPFSGG